eukprot:11166826-Lingulodinium_polyedra.AAC.1
MPNTAGSRVQRDHLLAPALPWLEMKPPERGCKKCIGVRLVSTVTAGLSKSTCKTAGTRLQTMHR